VRGAIALVLLALALDGGAYGLASRHAVAVAVWATIGLGVLSGLLRVARPSAGSAAAGGGLAGFALWNLVSTQWSTSAEIAFLEFDRALLYVGVFWLVALAARGGDLHLWCDGIGLGLTAVGTIALASRMFPGTLPEPTLPRFLPATESRLTYPLNYWNALAVLLALAAPLLLRAAVAAASPAARGFALAPFAILAAAVYLTSSRGGAAAAAVGSLAFVVTARRAAAYAAVAAAALASTAAVVIVAAHHALAAQPLDRTAAAGAGGGAAAEIVLLAAATAIAFAFGCRHLPPLPRLGPAARWSAGALVVAGVAAAVAVAEPARRLAAFERPPHTSGVSANLVHEHLLSAGGSGRWQLWRAALDEFASRPLVGRGAGSFEAWWLRHAPYPVFVRDAHSLYLEVLGELGAIGLSLLAAALVAALVTAGRALLRPRDDGLAAAGLASALLAYLFAAGIDWMWESTVVSVVGVAVLALVTATATRAPSPPRRVAVAAIVAVAALAGAAETLPLVAATDLRRSEVAARAGDLRAARAGATAARHVEPWASSPYVQLALVDEQAGRLRSAQRDIRSAIARSPDDWRAWLVATRIDTKAGDIRAARRSLARARELNPWSPLLYVAPTRR
jgi:hypothetical protein